MQLENCVYDYFELTTLNMAQQGLFGEVLHAEGAYIHNLKDYWESYEGDWRLQYNKEFRGDVYATHGMGPAAQLMDLHRGDKMNTLVAMDTRPVNIPEYLIEERGMQRDSAYQFANGQHTMTMYVPGEWHQRICQQISKRRIRTRRRDVWRRRNSRS